MCQWATPEADWAGSNPELPKGRTVVAGQVNEVMKVNRAALYAPTSLVENIRWN
jgi:hypothetical protein